MDHGTRRGRLLGEGSGSDSRAYQYQMVRVSLCPCSTLMSNPSPAPAPRLSLNARGPRLLLGAPAPRLPLSGSAPRLPPANHTLMSVPMPKPHQRTLPLDPSLRSLHPPSIPSLTPTSQQSTIKSSIVQKNSNKNTSDTHWAPKVSFPEAGTKRNQRPSRRHTGNIYALFSS